MKKNRFIPLLSALLFTATLVSFANGYKVSKINGEGCDHVGYHYEMVSPSQDAPGHYEFWVCCHCHEVFLNEPTVGSFVNNDDAFMTGGLDETHPAYISYENSLTVTFVNLDNTTITKYVNKGDDLLDIPTPSSKTGYYVSWDRTDFTNITENIVVNATSTAKTFTLSLNPNGGYVSSNTLTVTYDQPYSLEEPIHDEYMFDTWKYGEVEVSLTGTWNIDSDSESIELIAIWGESEWTDIY